MSNKINNKTMSQLKELLYEIKELQDDKQCYSRRKNILTTTINNLHNQMKAETDNVKEQEQLIKEHHRLKKNYRHMIIKDIFGGILSLGLLFGVIPTIATTMPAIVTWLIGIASFGGIVHLTRKTLALRENFEAVKIRYRYFKPETSIKTSKIKISELKMKVASCERDYSNYQGLINNTIITTNKRKKELLEFISNDDNMQSIKAYSDRYCNREVKKGLSELMQKIKTRRK